MLHLQLIYMLHLKYIPYAAFPMNVFAAFEINPYATSGDYLIPRSCTATKQNRAFSAAGASIWNGLPFELRSLPCDFLSSFYSLLKTFLFARAWAGSQWRIQEFSKEGARKRN